MMECLTVYPPGYKFRQEGLELTVTEILILGHKGRTVRYKCEWWSGNEHKSDWFDEFQLVNHDPITICRLIGFHG